MKIRKTSTGLFVMAGALALAAFIVPAGAAAAGLNYQGPLKNPVVGPIGAQPMDLLLCAALVGTGCSDNRPLPPLEIAPADGAALATSRPEALREDLEGGIGAQNAQVSTSSLTIVTDFPTAIAADPGGGDPEGVFYLVAGDNGSNGFSDVVLLRRHKPPMPVSVNNSYGVPPARRYFVSGNLLMLSFASMPFPEGYKVRVLYSPDN
jgi:hypothetical protein